MFGLIGLGPKIYLVVVLLAVVASAISFVGIDAMQTYNRRVHQIQHYTHSTVVGEEVNGLILAVVMDSRGIYMARDHAEAEKYAPLIVKNLAVMKQKMAEWTEFTGEGGHGQDGPRERPRGRIYQVPRRAGAPVARSGPSTRRGSYGDNDADQEQPHGAQPWRNGSAQRTVGEAHVKELTERTQAYYEGEAGDQRSSWRLHGGLLALFAVVLVVRHIMWPITLLTAAMTELAAVEKAMSRYHPASAKTRSAIWRARSACSRSERLPPRV